MTASQANNGNHSSPVRTSTERSIPMRTFDASLPMALLQAREEAMRLFRPMLAEYDITEQQWRVLRVLSSTDEPLAIGDVADRTFLLGPSLSRIVVNLEERNLVKRAPAPEDQRRSMLALAPAGRRLVNNVAPHSEATYNNIERCFGRERLQDLLTELHDLTLSIDSASKES